MPSGKTIRIYLTDGAPTGPMVAEIINWSTCVTVVPRFQLHATPAKRSELQRTGVYVLVGPDAKLSRDRIYVGEADEVFERLKQHDKDPAKDFWTHAAAITSKDENLTKAHGRYLECRLIEFAKGAARARRLENNTSPGPKMLPEPDVADMDYFLEQIKLVFPVLGFGFLQAPVTTGKALETLVAQSPKLIMSEVGASATALEIDGRFVVLKASTARKAGSASWDSYITLRDDLVAQQKLVSKDEKMLTFAEDVEFSSPSGCGGGRCCCESQWKDNLAR